MDKEPESWHHAQLWKSITAISCWTYSCCSYFITQKTDDEKIKNNNYTHRLLVNYDEKITNWERCSNNELHPRLCSQYDAKIGLWASSLLFLVLNWLQRTSFPPNLIWHYFLFLFCQFVNTAPGSNILEDDFWRLRREPCQIILEKDPKHHKCKESENLAGHLETLTHQSQTRYKMVRNTPQHFKHPPQKISISSVWTA